MNLRNMVIAISAVLLLSACSNNKETEKKGPVSVKEEKQDEVVEAIKPEYPPAQKSPESIVQQNLGEMTQEAMTLVESNSDQAAWEDLLKDFQVAELDQDSIYNGLIHTFGFDFQETHDNLANYEPDFGEFEISSDKESYKNIAIQVDSSGSMGGKVSGGVKMDLAKNAVKDYASRLAKDSFVSLRVYGHEGTGKESDKQLSCSSTEMVYETSTYDEKKFKKALNTFKPSGWTPLAASIQSAYEDLKLNASEDSENILFIVSDGVETCEGDPVQEAKKLAESDLNVEVNIIGFNVDDAGQKQLKATADAGNGKYYTVNSKVELTDTIFELLDDVQATTKKNFDKAKSGYKINMLSVELGEEIRDLSGLFRDVISEENRLLSQVIQQLQVQGQITESVAESLRVLVDEREEALLSYRESLQEGAFERKETKRQEIFDYLDSN
ncbi:VWA domain-containing protein [Bacillus sp. 31A1R]|uniref:VWA domain-containing protein n=1 Tax=Robertmurraya mangrovi TaxID=3098077 RepID=A0ABU5J4U0_9BACI|nr:VWA domain-containing protein [Bacillus sp. 31A1R]MDZ5474432.1 VWA domain-containing protein [Bacillus sp. 31A1R]